MTPYYKIVEIIDGHPHTLYHGLNGSRKLPLSRWINAKQSIVNDGGRPYISGFHIFLSREEAERYLKRFTKPRDLRVIKCCALGVQAKPTNWRVKLAKRIKIEYETYTGHSGNR